MNLEQLNSLQPPPTSRIFESYKARLIPPFCEKLCEREKRCGVCELWCRIEHSHRNMNLKFTDNIIRTPNLASRYLLLSPTFITVRDLLFIYSSRFIFIYDVFREFPDFEKKPEIEAALEKMIAICSDPVISLDTIVRTMEETILLAECIMAGQDEALLRETMHMFGTIKLIQYPAIVPTTEYEQELLSEISKRLPQIESDNLKRSLQNSDLQCIKRSRTTDFTSL